jgi:hypothetical protein
LRAISVVPQAHKGARCCYQAAVKVFSDHGSGV